MGAQERTTIEVVNATGDIVTTCVLPEGARPDLGSVDAMCRFQLEARRLGWSIRLRTTCPRLGGLVDLVGLAEVLGLSVEAER